MKNFHSLWRNQDLGTTELSSGIFSCLKLSGDSVFAGMINGDIRQLSLHTEQSEVGRIFQVESRARVVVLSLVQIPRDSEL